MPRCCRSTPRCRSCPVWRLRDVLDLRELVAPSDVPPHLEGVPSCLHKYEDVLRRDWERREQQAAAGAETAA